MKKLLIGFKNVALFIVKFLWTALVIVPVGIFLVLWNHLKCLGIILKWLMSGSKVRNNDNNGMFHRTYFSTTYRVQRMFNNCWNK